MRPATKQPAMFSAAHRAYRSALLVLAAMAAGTAAHADLTIVQSVTVTGAQLPAAVTSPRTLTWYLSGQLARLDSGSQSLIVDRQAGTVTRLDSTAHTYSTRTFVPGHRLLPTGADIGAVGPMNPISTDQGDAQAVAGRQAHHYLLTVADPVTSSTCVANVWMATDLNLPVPLIVDDSPLSIVQSRLSALPGIPLRISMTITGGPDGGVTGLITASSVSILPVAASTFTIPSNYTASATPAVQ